MLKLMLNLKTKICQQCKIYDKVIIEKINKNKCKDFINKSKWLGLDWKYTQNRNAAMIDCDNEKNVFLNFV